MIIKIVVMKLDGKVLEEAHIVSGFPRTEAELCRQVIDRLEPRSDEDEWTVVEALDDAMQTETDETKRVQELIHG